MADLRHTAPYAEAGYIREVYRLLTTDAPLINLTGVVLNQAHDILHHLDGLDGCDPLGTRQTPEQLRAEARDLQKVYSDVRTERKTPATGVLRAVQSWQRVLDTPPHHGTEAPYRVTDHDTITGV